MKRFFIALALLAVIITSASVTSFTAAKKLKETGSAVLSSSEIGTEESRNTEKLRKAVKLWDKNRRFLFVVTFHDDFSEIEEMMTSLEYYSLNPDFEKSAEICYQAGALLTSLAEDFYVTLENIF